MANCYAIRSILYAKKASQIVWAAFLRLQFEFVIFKQKEISAQAVRKMLVKLTPDLLSQFSSFPIFPEWKRWKGDCIHWRMFFHCKRGSNNNEHYGEQND